MSRRPPVAANQAATPAAPPKAEVADPATEAAVPADLAARLVAWQRQHGRHDLPWQGADAYRVWLSEVMLQQTQVRTVLRYYDAFLARFPTVAALLSLIHI